MGSHGLSRNTEYNIIKLLARCTAMRTDVKLETSLNSGVIVRWLALLLDWSTLACRRHLALAALRLPVRQPCIGYYYW
jgi:hypothetical protein